MCLQENKPIVNVANSKPIVNSEPIVNIANDGELIVNSKPIANSKSIINNNELLILNSIKMNWKKINLNHVDKANLPDFKVDVLLAQKIGDKEYSVTTGFLKSINSEGPHWSTKNHVVFNKLKEMLSTADSTSNTFIPTHWSEIELPED